MSAFTLNALSHGWSGLGLLYTSVQAPMLAGMIRTRARWQQLLLAPVSAVPVTALAGVGLTMLNPALQGLGMAPSLLEQLVLGGALSAGLGYAAGLAIARPNPSHYRYLRGANVVEGERSALARDLESAGARSSNDHSVRLTLAGLVVPQADETKHFKFIGTTGTGKSTAIGELLAAALRRGDRAVIADPDGGYLRRFYDPKRGDIVLNPFDQRSVKWDLFGEISQPYDVEQLSRSLLPDAEGADRSWRGYARTFLTAVTRQAHAAGVRDVGELYRLLVIAPTSELRALTGGTPAQPFLEEHNGRMFDSIRSVTSSAVGSLEHIARQSGAPFSVREWVRRGRDGQGGVLFIPYRAPQIAALRSTVSAWMRIAIFEAMDGPEQDQRLWFVVDELDALGQIDGLKDALARVRKFGGRCILGLQSIAQVASTYGAGDAHTIVENCGNSLILRCSASEGGGTSRFASTLIGQREVIRTALSRSRRPGEIHDSVTRGEHYSVESAVMDSQIEQLPDLSGYLKFASQDRWVRVGLTPLPKAVANEPGRAVPPYIPVEPRPTSAVPPSPAAQVSAVAESSIRGGRVKSAGKASAARRRRAPAPRAAPAARTDASLEPGSPEQEL
jgi:hypothetical protein